MGGDSDATNQDGRHWQRNSLGEEWNPDVYSGQVKSEFL